MREERTVARVVAVTRREAVQQQTSTSTTAPAAITRTASSSSNLSNSAYFTPEENNAFKTLLNLSLQVYTSLCQTTIDVTMLSDYSQFTCLCQKTINITKLSLLEEIVIGNASHSIRDIRKYCYNVNTVEYLNIDYRLPNKAEILVMNILLFNVICLQRHLLLFTLTYKYYYTYIYIYI